MKRFIRTKDGKIIDIKQLYFKQLSKNNFSNYFINDDGELLCRNSLLEKETKAEIIKQADTIEELVDFGDLTNDGFVERKVQLENIRKGYHIITELYTKQGNNYILVAKKENGEWRVI